MANQINQKPSTSKNAFEFYEGFNLKLDFEIQLVPDPGKFTRRALQPGKDEREDGQENVEHITVQEQEAKCKVSRLAVNAFNTPNHVRPLSAPGGVYQSAGEIPEPWSPTSRYNEISECIQTRCRSAAGNTSAWRHSNEDRDTWNMVLRDKTKLMVNSISTPILMMESLKRRNQVQQCISEIEFIIDESKNRKRYAPIPTESKVSKNASKKSSTELTNCRKLAERNVADKLQCFREDPAALALLEKRIANTKRDESNKKTKEKRKDFLADNPIEAVNYTLEHQQEIMHNIFKHRNQFRRGVQRRRTTISKEMEKKWKQMNHTILNQVAVVGDPIVESLRRAKREQKLMKLFFQQKWILLVQSVASLLHFVYIFKNRLQIKITARTKQRAVSSMQRSYREHLRTRHLKTSYIAKCRLLRYVQIICRRWRFRTCSQLSNQIVSFLREVSRSKSALVALRRKNISGNAQVIQSWWRYRIQPKLRAQERIFQLIWCKREQQLLKKSLLEFNTSHRTKEDTSRDWISTNKRSMRTSRRRSKVGRRQTLIHSSSRKTSITLPMTGSSKENPPRVLRRSLTSRKMPTASNGHVRSVSEFEQISRKTELHEKVDGKALQTHLEQDAFRSELEHMNSFEEEDELEQLTRCRLPRSSQSLCFSQISEEGPTQNSYHQLPESRFRHTPLSHPARLQDRVSVPFLKGLSRSFSKDTIHVLAHNGKRLEATAQDPTSDDEWRSQTCRRQLVRETSASQMQIVEEEILESLSNRSEKSSSTRTDGYTILSSMNRTKVSRKFSQDHGNARLDVQGCNSLPSAESKTIYYEHVKDRRSSAHLKPLLSDTEVSDMPARLDKLRRQSSKSSILSRNLSQRRLLARRSRESIDSSDHSSIWSDGCQSRRSFEGIGSSTNRNERRVRSSCSIQSDQVLTTRKKSNHSVSEGTLASLTPVFKHQHKNTLKKSSKFVLLPRSIVSNIVKNLLRQNRLRSTVQDHPIVNNLEMRQRIGMPHFRNRIFKTEKNRLDFVIKEAYRLWAQQGNKNGEPEFFKSWEFFGLNFDSNN